MNKQEALQRLDAIEKEQAALRAIIEAPGTPERVGSYGFVPEAGSNEEYYYLTGSSFWNSGYGVMFAADNNAGQEDQSLYEGLFWKTQEDAELFADAMNVFLELRTLEGVKVFEVDEENYYLYYDYEYNTIRCKHRRTISEGMLVYYETEEYAKAATNHIGEERLKRAFRVLSGRTN